MLLKLIPVPLLEYIVEKVLYTNSDDPRAPPALFLDKKLFSHLHVRGIAVVFMNVNDVDTLHLALENGATAILSDRISHIADYLKAHPELKFKKLG